MKKLMISLLALMVATSVSAQKKYLNDPDTPFAQGKTYIEASLSSFDLSSQFKHFHFGLSGRGGYFFQDNLLGLGELGYSHLEDTDDTFTIGAGARYYFSRNGFYAGAMLKFKHYASNMNDFVPALHAGYAFFLGRSVTIEPELYFDFSTKNFDYSCYGVGVGFGVFL